MFSLLLCAHTILRGTKYWLTRLVLVVLKNAFSSDFKEPQGLYKLTKSNIPHGDEAPKSDYYDPLFHGNRESNRQLSKIQETEDGLA